MLVGSTISELDPESHPRQDICLPSYHVELDASGNSPGDSGLDLPPPYRP